MCQVANKCKAQGNFWIQTRREVLCPGNPEMGIEPFRSTLSLTACAAHLPKAVRGLSEINSEAADGILHPETDGVIVKVRVGKDLWR